MNRTIIALLAFSASLLAATTLLAASDRYLGDLSIYSARNSLQPNVLIIIDNSGSMQDSVPGEAYDPQKTYPLFYGIHNIYVDKKTMPAYKKGGPYPEGSRFVVVQHTIRNEGSKVVKGKKSMVVLMKKDAKQTATGGWLFAGFTPEGKPSGVDPVKNCFECHLKEAKDRDFVISRYADFK